VTIVVSIAHSHELEDLRGGTYMFKIGHGDIFDLPVLVDARHLVECLDGITNVREGNVNGFLTIKAMVLAETMDHATLAILSRRQ